METRSCSLFDTEQCAIDVVQRIGGTNGTRRHAAVVGLKGELGAGKTAFVKAAAQALGVVDTVTSPTFVIMKVYKLRDRPFNHLIHIDAYRLESSDELKALGWDDVAADPKNIIFLEWPERVKELLPDDTVFLTFEVAGETTRTISLESA